MPDITIHTIETAPEEVKDVLQTVKDANGGFIPNLIGLLANAPTALETYRTVGEINRRNSLTPVSYTHLYPIIPSIANEKIREITFFLLKKDEATTITRPMHAAIHMGIKGAKIIEVKYLSLIHIYTFPFPIMRVCHK